MTKRLITPPGYTPEAQAAPPQAQLNINPSQLEDVQCEKCTNFTFNTVSLIKRLSPLQSPTSREAFVPVQVFACAACGHVNDRFIAGLNGWFQTKPDSAAPEAPAENSDGIVSSHLKLVTDTEAAYQPANTDTGMPGHE